MAWTYDEETEIYTVPYNELDDLLTSLDDNTKETPYKLNIIDLTVIEFTAPFPLRNKICNYSTKYIDISYTDIPDSIKNSITNFNYMFSGCSTLVGCFDLWAGITSMESCFSNCSSLKKSPKLPTEITNMFRSFINSGIEEIIVPPNVTNLEYTFSSCSSLKKVYFETTSSFSNINMNTVFIYCTSLELICVNKSLNSSLISILKTQQNQRNFPTEIVISNIVKNYWYDEENDIYIITDFSETENLLQSLDDNTEDNPYILNIKNLNTSDVIGQKVQGALALTSQLALKLIGGDRFVDLRYTILPPAVSLYSCFGECSKLVKIPDILPTTVTDMEYCFLSCSSLKNVPENILYNYNNGASSRISSLKFCFKECTSLQEMPNIPTSVTTLQGTFISCNSLVETKEIPSSVTNMQATFRYCTNLETVKNIPRQTTVLISCFQGCENLKSIELWDYNSVTTSNSENCFEGCTSLEEIFVSVYNASNLITLLNNVKNNGGFPSEIVPSEIVFYNYTEDISIPVTSLNDYLQHTKPNTEDNPYQLIITGLNLTNLGKSSVNNTLGNIIKNNTKYISLKNTQFPISITTLFESFEDCAYLVEFLKPANMLELTNLTNMQSCFRYCTSLIQAPAIPNSVTDMTLCFSGCTSLTQAPVIPNSVIDMYYCFYGCTSLTQAPVIPNSVIDMYYCFSGCTSLTQAPAIPNSVTDMTLCFYGCSSLKKIIFSEKFEQMPTSVSNIFKNCTNLESVYVKSSQNRSDLISILEEQQTSGQFPSDLIVSEIVKFDEKILKVKTEIGVEKIKLYRSKEQLLTKKNGQFVYADETEKPFTVNINGEDFYAQTLKGELIDDCKIKGTGFVLKKIIGDEPVFIAKQSGRIETPFDLPKQELYRITADGTLDVDGSLLPKGGVIFVCSGKGSGVSGSIGGNGYVHRVEIPSNTDFTINAAFSINPDSNGEMGNEASVGDYYCSGTSGYMSCVSTITHGSGTSGGRGGSNIDVTVIIGNKTKNITVYGGGGGGGLGGVATGYSSCTALASACDRRNKKTTTANGGHGGLTGAGTGTRISSNERIGGAGLSYNQENLSGKYLEWVSDACVIVYKYTE